MSAQSETVRSAGALYLKAMYSNLPEDSDKTYLLIKLNEIVMWANILMEVADEKAQAKTSVLCQGQDAEGR